MYISRYVGKGKLPAPPFCQNSSGSPERVGNVSKEKTAGETHVICFPRQWVQLEGASLLAYSILYIRVNPRHRNSSISQHESCPPTPYIYIMVSGTTLEAKTCVSKEAKARLKRKRKIGQFLRFQSKSCATAMYHGRL